MKKSIIGVITLLLSITTFAHHINSTGWCSGHANFTTVNFANNALVQVRLYPSDSIVLQYTTPATGNADVSFTLDQPYKDSSIQIQFRYELLDSLGFFDWRGNDSNYITSSTSQLTGCLTMELQFTDFTAKKSGNNLNISFTNQDESNVSRYEVLMSSNPNDSTKWVTAKTIIPDGSHTYSFSLPLSYKIAAGAGTVAFFLPFMIGFKKRKKYVNIIALVLFFSIAFWSCKKEAVENTANYNTAKIKVIFKDGSSPVTSHDLKF
jgi:hypothetical protein